ncbi:prolyl oligopeptidase family serine peptidase [Rubripirellula amarantea]|nr:prolyl oligopeptidase family serine peptidase [Rubripirellula amarantea]
MPPLRTRLFLSFCLIVATAFPVDAETYKSLPPAGIEIDASDKRDLEARITAIRNSYQRAGRKTDVDVNQWQPHVDALVRAVDLAIKQNGFFHEKDVARANLLLDEAERRIKTISRAKNKLTWLGLESKPLDKPQLVVGGFRSQIDHSVQPFGLVIPANFDLAKTYRVDVWLHGRGDNKTEIAFLDERSNKIGEYAPEDTIVLHPFGRHCNAFKFAGETDVYESLDALRQLASVDDDRVALRGFSMGGAGVWHIAAHDPTRWFAVNPGAGFVDTIVYQNWGQKTPYPISEVGKKLLRIYDVLPWASNLQNTHVVAYSGEVDKQRQAAERVTQSLSQQSIKFEHIIGEGMAHKIDEPSKKKINDLLQTYANEAEPARDIHFVTHHLRYNDAGWVSVEGLKQHYEPGTVIGSVNARGDVRLQTDGVTAIQLLVAPMKISQSDNLNVTIDGQTLDPWLISDKQSLDLSLADDGQWKAGPLATGPLRKRPGMQGPIDDAFCSRFLFVIPSRPASHGTAQRFIDREMKYAGQRWKTLMRGDIHWVKDTDVTQEQIRSCNLICFGDFTSNQYLAKVASELPIHWTKDKLSVGNQSFDPTTSVAAFCYPNPENPERYVVANSGMTFRDFSNVSNSRQIAMLGDWAIFDADSTENGIFAGDILAEGLFDETWNISSEEN